MTLIADYDIRAESYANGASVSLLNDLAGTTDLSSNGGNSYPTYNAAENAMSFNGTSQTIGSTSLQAALAAIPTGAAWSVFVLVKQATFSSGFIAGLGIPSSFNQSFYLRDEGTGLVDTLIRADDASADQQQSTATRDAGDWDVIHACYNGTNLTVGFNGGSIGSQALDALIAGNTWSQLGLGAYWRDGIANWWAGLMRAARFYNSNETANLGAICAAMQAGPVTDTEIDGALESITLTTFAASVALSVAISGALESISLSTFPASIAAATSISAVLESIALATSAATIAGISQPPDIADYQIVTISTPNATAAKRITAVADIEAGDLLAWGDVAGIGSVNVADDATFDADLWVQSFDVQVWDGTEWGAVGLQTLDISQAIESISLTTFSASIESSYSISGALEAISLATFNALVSSGFSVAAELEGIAVTSYRATIIGESDAAAPAVSAAGIEVVRRIFSKPTRRVITPWRKTRF
jgi:hypothetical protein